jgi:hypothetical protein
VSDALACPSGRCRPGSHLLGIRTDEGLGYIDPPLPVTEEFMELVESSGGGAEQRFRFTERCIEQGCGQWSGGGCGVIERLLASAGPSSELPVCGIRERCRWFAQRGADACAVCPYVVTDNAQTLVPIEFDLVSST